ncbi:MAG TPA: M20/M25/M40 family metallo-hydrolase [Gelidibacter sp.]|uniref:M20/M25/M40 family metallo-hydrolase n=1 Tax=Gelidibacter sp. TaxID=2018083 RepID=UPI002B6F007D|nr:M20/M25/M40 family metallo-hydrolase [Gelidibacter sp.]HXJ97951.1 M20/M25/M40 family metallo-hydrolase [Gelidibacter sp.]
MRKLTLALWLLLIPTVSFSQEASIIQQIKKEGIENSQVMDIAFHLTEISGPRLMNSPGYYRAMDYSINQLKDWGLENVKKDEWGNFGKGWELKKFYIAMKSPWYKPVIAFPKAWTRGTSGLKTASIILIDPSADSTALVNKYRGKLAGKILAMDQLIEYELGNKADVVRYTRAELDSMAAIQLEKKEAVNPAEMAEQRRKRMEAWRESRKKAEVLGNLAREEGAIAIISSSPRNHDGTVFVQGGGAYAMEAPENFLDIAMALEDYNMIVRLVRANKPVELDLEVETQFYNDEEKGYNVIGEITGTDPKLKDELVMIGGHLDSWQGSVGATDNASGTAVMMEAIRILKKLNIKPKRTVRIALWGGEEQGIHGSRGYVAKTFANREDMKLKPAHEKFSVYFNLDNGTGRIRGIHLQENQAASNLMKTWLTPFKDLDATTITLSNTGGTDHLSFDAVGLPGFQFIQDQVEYNSRTHHSNMDSYDHLVADDLKQAATVIAGLIYQAAVSDQKVPRKELPKAQKSQF